MNSETFEIPYGKWENLLWYKRSISDMISIPENIVDRAV